VISSCSKLNPSWVTGIRVRATFSDDEDGDRAANSIRVAKSA